MITAFLMAALALVIGFIMGANAAKSKIMHDIEVAIRAQKQEQRDYQSNWRTVNGTFHRME
jgi:hypothetical protein